MTDFDDVGDFHRKFGLPNVPYTYPDCLAKPTNLHMDPNVMDFRLVLIKEELKELTDGIAAEDIAEIADAIVDMVYVLHGLSHTLGLPWQELWDDVQRANMSKVRAQPDGSDSKRGSGLDVVKPEGWQGPRTVQILRDHGFDA